MTDAQKANSLRQELKKIDDACAAALAASPLGHGKGASKAPPQHLTGQLAAKAAKDAKAAGLGSGTPAKGTSGHS